MKLFASENYVDEKISKALDSIQKEVVESKIIFEEFEKFKTELQQIFNDNMSNLRKDYSAKLSELKNGFLEFEKLFENIKTDVSNHNDQLGEFKVELDVLQHEKDLTTVIEKIDDLDKSTLEHFQLVHNIISKLSDISLYKSKTTATTIKSISTTHKDTTSFDKRLFDLDEKHGELASKVDAAIELIFEKLANKISEDDLPPQLSGDLCPFKSKQGYCEIWATRKNKSDALTYCSSCIQSSMLLDKGIKL